MIVKTETDKNCFYVEVTDMITKEDVRSLVPAVEEIISQHKKVKYLVYLNNVKGYTLTGFLADMNFYFKHRESFDYMAIVGDKELEKGLIDLASMLMPDKEVKYFDVSQLEKAKEWIKQA